MISVVEVRCYQWMEANLSLEEIQEICQRQTQSVSNFFPESIEDVSRRAHQYRVYISSRNA